MFQLTLEEWNSSQIVMSLDTEAEVIDNQSPERMSQIVTTSEGGKAATEDVDNQQSGNWSQIVTSSGEESKSEKPGLKKHRGKTYLPYAFTEHGVSMLASVLRS
jgi:ORF6N domain